MLSQNPRQAEFVLGTCPHCQKVVRIPVTAVTSQSTSQVGCPICGQSFELASVLEEMIPAVKVVDDVPVADSTAEPAKPRKINAIDTPELFHNIPKVDYEPITEKKNGRFVVPDLLSRGIDKKGKKKRKSRRRRSSNDPDVAKSLAKLRENTSSTTLDPSRSFQTENDERDGESRDRKSSRRKVRIRKKVSSPRPETKTRQSGGLVPSVLGVPRRLRRMFQRNLTSDADSDATGTDILLVILGAMIAIPSLQLMLWWIFSADPLGMARPTSRILPFLVPRSLQAPLDPGTLGPVEPSKQTIIDDSFFESSSRPSTSSPDGILRKPSVDPASVHNDDVD